MWIRSLVRQLYSWKRYQKRSCWLQNKDKNSCWWSKQQQQNSTISSSQKPFSRQTYRPTGLWPTAIWVMKYLIATTMTRSFDWQSIGWKVYLWSCWSMEDSKVTKGIQKLSWLILGLMEQRGNLLTIYRKRYIL